MWVRPDSSSEPLSIKLKKNFKPSIAVSIKDEELPFLNNQVLELVEYIELRVDLCKDLTENYLVDLLKELHKFQKKIIITIRDPSEGGGRDLSAEHKLALYEALSPYTHLIDTEVASGLVAELKKKLPEKTIIGSFHDFQNTPEGKTLREIYHRAKSQGADIVKIATMANDLDAFKTLAGFCINELNDKVVVGMGRYAVLSRVVFPFLGSLFTYASIGQPKAPGQINVSSLQELISLLVQ